MAAIKSSAGLTLAGGMSLLSRTVYDTSTTVTLDPKAKMLHVICMGGGAGGWRVYNEAHSYGGMGGLREEAWIPASLVTAPVSVTIGAGSAAGALNQSHSGYDEYGSPTYSYNPVAPLVGGNTSFGTLLTALGGSPGKHHPLIDSHNTPIGNRSSTTLFTFIESRNYNNNTPPQRTRDITVYEGQAILSLYQSLFSADTIEHQLNSWHGNIGGCGLSYISRYNSSNGGYTQFELPAGASYPDPQAATIMTTSGITVSRPGVGDYPGSGGGYSQKGGHPSGGGGVNAAGASGRVILYQYG